MSNQDEDDVEDELDALEAELSGAAKLPEAPTAQLPEIERDEVEENMTRKARARAREEQRARAEPLAA